MKLSLISYCFLFLSLVLAVPVTLTAQSTVNEISRDELRDMLESNIVPTSRAVETIGSPYFNDEFTRGTLTFIDERVTEPMMINFNAYQNHVEIQDGRNILAVPGDRVSQFAFITDQKPILFKKGFSSRGLDEDDFVQVLSEGKVTLLKKHEVSFQENVALYGTATQRDEYISNERYYIAVDGEVERIRRFSERAITRIPDSFESEMEAFVNEFQPDLSTEEGAALYFNHYNQLVITNH